MTEPQPNDDIDCTPEGDYVFAVCEQDLKWKAALAELIDNSFDAGAQTVTIEFGPTRDYVTEFMSVHDDGAGCEDPTAMATLGKHRRQKTTELGRYGIGLKDAVLWAGGRDSEMMIHTVRGTSRIDFHVVWREMAKAWRLPARALTRGKAGPGDFGTRITVKPLAKRVPDGAAWQTLLADLGYIYSPALKRGRRILIRSKVRGSVPVSLEGHRMPPLSDVVDSRITVNGRGARVYVGIVQDGEANRYSGITYTHRFRVIKPSSRSGCGGRDFTKIAGIVDLDDSWVLTKNKNDISEHAEELFAAVYSECRALLEKAETLGQNLQLAALTAEAEQLLNGMLLGDPNAKAKRNKGDSSGTVKPKKRGRKHRRADEEQDGETFARARYGALRIRYVNYGELITLGEHKSGVVQLSEFHPWTSRLRDSRNAEAIAQLALTLFLDDVRKWDGDQTKFAWARESDIGRSLGWAFRQPVALDGQALLAAE